LREYLRCGAACRSRKTALTTGRFYFVHRAYGIHAGLQRIVLAQYCAAGHFDLTAAYARRYC
jgi:hypothetical protein